MNIVFFKDVNEKDIVGGKGANLSKMIKKGFNVPNGFVITADSFKEYLSENKVNDEINNLIENCNVDDDKELEITSSKINTILDNCNIPNLIQEEILKFYKNLDCEYVAVRSSATSEDGKSHAWAGQLETFLNVDETNIIESVKKCWKSLFSPRALFYRVKNEDKSNISVAVVVQKMIQSEASGVAFSVNPVSNNRNEIIIEAVLGLGEAIVSGSVSPDSYIVDKNKEIIINKDINNQKSKIIKTKEGNEWITLTNGESQKISDKKILELANTIKDIESFYEFPVDVEWAIDNNEIFILQSRPITTVKKLDLADKIKNAGNWVFYVARQFNWFVENTEINASLAKYQRKTFGFDLATVNYLCLNGDEYALESDFDILCKRLDDYFNKDIDFFDKFANYEFGIVEDIKKYFEYIKKKNFKELSYSELAKEVKKFNDIYIMSFISGMTRPDDYLTYAFERELKKDKFNEEDIKRIFSKVSTCPNYYPMSYSEEPVDLLKIAIEAKKGNNVDQLIDEHVEKYAWLKGPVETIDTAFSKKDYLERLENLKKANVEKRLNRILEVRENDNVEYEKIMKEYRFSTRAEKIIKAIRNFVFLRTYTTEYSDHLFFIGRNTLFKEISRKTGIKPQDLIMLDDKEIISILNNNGKMNSNIANTLDSRKKAFAMIWINGEVETVFGDEALAIQKDIANTFKTSNNDEQKCDENVITGNIANKGKVKGTARVLLTYEDIYKVQKGDIIVATMTTPDYISAMEKASGFITDEGGITCHAAILSREFDVPCIVGTVNATKEIKDGEIIELDAYTGKIYKINKLL